MTKYFFCVVLLTQSINVQARESNYFGGHYWGKGFVTFCKNEARQVQEQFEKLGIAAKGSCEVIPTRSSVHSFVKVKYHSQPWPNALYIKPFRFFVSTIEHCMQLIEKVEENYRTGDASVESFHFINAHCDMTVAPSKLFTFDYVQKADQPKKTIVAKLAHSVFLSKEDCETKAKEMEDDHSKKDLPWLLSFCEKVDSSSGNPYRLSFAYVQDKSE